MTQNKTKPSLENLASFIDHTLLKAEASQAQFDKLYQEAKEYSFKAVCVPPFQIETAKEQLSGSQVLVCTVIGFPLGSQASAVKVFETQQALKSGADEIDMVANISKIKDGQLEFLKSEVASVKEACGTKTLKVILETCLLTDEEKYQASQACLAAGADYIKTSTGFSCGGADKDSLAIMLKASGSDMKVKASGGIKSLETALEYLEMGVSRLGTSSGVQLMNHQKTSGEY